jgi:hypothetical protein
MKRGAVAISVFVLLLGAACASDGAQPAPAPPDAGADAAAPDAPAVAADAGAEAPRGALVRFSLRNETGKVIYLQSGGYWTLMRGGQLVRAEPSCEYCDCNGPGCAVCGVALAEVITVPAGATHGWEWAGFHWALRTGIKPVECEEAESVAPGPLLLRTTYSFSFSRTDSPPESRIGAPISVDTTFEFPPTADVIIVAR